MPLPSPLLPAEEEEVLPPNIRPPTTSNSAPAVFTGGRLPQQLITIDPVSPRESMPTVLSRPIPPNGPAAPNSTPSISALPLPSNSTPALFNRQPSLGLFSFARMCQESAVQRQEATRILQKELRDLRSHQQEGFTITCNEDNLFRWTVGIFGPPDTPFQGGYFKALLVFPCNYPNLPPKMWFSPPLFHPNIYKTGDVCISTLHSPGDEPRSGESSTERWNSNQSVRTVLISVISLLNDPNTRSPANVEASISYRKYKENGDQDYPTIIRKQVEASKENARKEGVQVPETTEDYVIKAEMEDDDDGYSTAREDSDEHVGPFNRNAYVRPAREVSTENVRAWIE